jgi:hypothetical protein
MPQFIIDFFSESHNPIEVVILILKNGGLVIFFPLLLWMCWHGWHIWIQEKYIHKKKRVLLAIDVPKLTEQNMKSIEQIITALHGVHFSPNKKEAHWIGVVQDNFSLEIVSIDGYVQYFVRCDDYNVELVKGAIFAQYPDAEIIEVEDYVKNVPTHFPDPVYDMWGCEFILAKSAIYPIKTYEHFEHSLSGTFADPIAAVLEALSRIHPGEQVWLQIVLTPEGHHWAAHAQHEVDKLAGKPVHEKTHWWDFIFDIPQMILGGIRDQIWPLEAGSDEHGAGHDEAGSNFMALTTGEKIVVEEAQKKLARLVFETKFRFVYIAPKKTMNAYRVVGPVLGVLKQFNALDLNSLVVGHTCTSGPTYYRVQQRLNKIKSHLMEAYKHRSNEEGDTPFILSTAEIATLFHFPSELVRAPLVSKTESKKAEPPARLPLENSPFVSLRRTAVQPPAPAQPVVETPAGQPQDVAAAAANAGVPVARPGMVSAPLRPSIRKVMEDQTFSAPPPPDLQQQYAQTSVSPRKIPVQQLDHGVVQPSGAIEPAQALTGALEDMSRSVQQAVAAGRPIHSMQGLPPGVVPVQHSTITQYGLDNDPNTFVQPASAPAQPVAQPAPQQPRQYVVTEQQQQEMQQRIEQAKAQAVQWPTQPTQPVQQPAVPQQPAAQTQPGDPVVKKTGAPSNLPFG